MSIPVKIESEDSGIGFGGILEQCHFCGTSTRYWHENTNNPVCPSCAKRHKVADLPDWGRAIRENKRKKAKEATKC